MTYFDAILLGIIQGLTEFLPVSSSGHLVLAQHLLEVKMPGVIFELIVHLGTLIAVIVYFHRRLWSLAQSIFRPAMKDERKMILLLALGTIPAAVAGVLLKDFFEAAFGSPFFTSVMMLVTGIVLYATSFVKSGTGDVTFKRAFIIGVGQAISILPGISRSGATISTGLFAGVKPVVAAEYSFLLSIPAIAGALIFKLEDFLQLDAQYAGQFILGAIASFLFGLLAVYLLLGIIRKGKFKYFGYYCLLVGLLGIYHFY